MSADTRRRAILLVAMVVMAACLVLGLLRPDVAAGGAQRLIETARDTGGMGWLVLVGLQLLVAASGVLPASLLGVAAGATYGLGVGFALAAVGTLGGAMVAFALSRSLFREMIARQLARRPGMARFDALLARDGWRIVCLLRLSPIMPFAATSYALGMSAIGWRAYTIGTLASLPALFGYVFVGRFAEAGLDAWSGRAGALRWGLLAAGAVATVLLTLLVGHLARNAVTAKGG